MKKNKKGAALIIAIFITTVLLILSGGLLTLVRYSIDQTFDKQNEQKLFYAAEAGLNHGLRKLQMSSVYNFNSGSVSGLEGHIFEIDNMKVVISSAYNSDDGWTLKSTASFPNNSDGKSVINTLSNIRSASMTDMSMAMASSMEINLEFASSLENQNNGDINSAQDINSGDQYFGGTVNIEGKPIFDGEITSASKSKSDRKDEKGSHWYKNGKNLATTLQEIVSGTYLYGIWDKTNGSIYNEDENQMTSRLGDIFPNGYNGNQNAVDFRNNVAYDYNTLSSFSSSIILPTSYKAVEVTIQDNLLKLDYGTFTDEITLSSLGNTIIFPKNYNTININESIIGTELTLAAEKATFTIKGDIYYKGLENYDDMSKAWGADLSNIEELKNKVSSVSYTFGLITYQGDITIDSFVGDTNDKILNDCLLLTGAYFTPNGTFGVNDTNNAKKFKGAKRLINLGSVLMDTKGLYRSNGLGITATLTNDDRFSKKSVRPIGFKQLVVRSASDNQDYIMLAKNGMNWSSVTLNK